MQTLQAYLKTHQATDGQSITHTRIPNYELNIVGKSYCIQGQDLEDFHHFYYDEIILNGKNEYLTEKQPDNGFIYVDFDFKYNHDIKTRQHNQTDIQTLLWIYMETLKDFFIFTEEPFFVYILEKPDVNILQDGSLTKDGIHMIIRIKMNHKLQLELRQRVLTKIMNSPDIKDEFKHLPLINDWNLILDEGLSKGSTNVQMYGSKKPNHDVYKLTYAFKYQIDLTDNQFMINPIDCTEVDYDTFRELSVQNTDIPEYELKPAMLMIKDPTLKHQFIVQSSNLDYLANTDFYTEIKQYIKCNCLSSRAGPGKYIEWVNLGIQLCSLFDTEPAFELWELFSTLYGTENKKNEYEKQFTYLTRKEHDKQKVLNTFRKWARDENPDEYALIQNTIIDTNKNGNPTHIKIIEPTGPTIDKPKYYASLTEEDRIKYIKIIEPTINSPTDYDFAFAFYSIFGNHFAITDKKSKMFYEFNNELWVQSEGVLISMLLSTKFFDIYDGYATDLQIQMDMYEDVNDKSKILGKKIKNIREISSKLKKTNDKTHIINEISNLCYNPKFNIGFNTAKYVLPIKNGLLFDMNTLTTRKRTISDKFTYECPVCYIEETDQNKDDFKWAEKYFKDLFSGNMDTLQVFINCIKTTFSGQILRHIFICTGDGSNGKSLLFKVISEIFSNGMDTISEKVFIQSKNNSNLNTEIEKLDKVRLGFMSEIDDNAKLNELLIKRISGGDKLNLRTIHKTDYSIIPTATLWGAFNVEPIFKVEKPIIKRIINFPFNANFETNMNFENEVLDKKDFIFSYIMKYGKFCHEIIPSDEMIEKKRKYVEDNSRDYLTDFIQSKIVRNVEAAQKRGEWCIKKDEFVREYHYWCADMKYHIEKLSPTAFTKRMTKNGISNKESNSIVWFENIQFRKEGSEDIENEDIENNMISGELL